MTVNHAIYPINRKKPVKIIKPNNNVLKKTFINNKSQDLRENRKNHAEPGYLAAWI